MLKRIWERAECDYSRRSFISVTSRASLWVVLSHPIFNFWDANCKDSNPIIIDYKHYEEHKKQQQWKIIDNLSRYNFAKKDHATIHLIPFQSAKLLASREIFLFSMMLHRATSAKKIKILLLSKITQIQTRVKIFKNSSCDLSS